MDYNWLYLASISAIIIGFIGFIVVHVTEDNEKSIMCDKCKQLIK